MPRIATPSPQPNSSNSGRLARRSAAPDAPLFAYGSLQFADVLTSLIGRVPPRAPAQAVGWKVIGLPDVVYPGLVAASGRVVGVTIFTLTDDEWRLLDAFENPIYDLRLLNLTDGRQAWSYVCTSNPNAHDVSWDADTFSRNHLPSYVRRCRAWRQTFVAHTPTTIE